MRGRGLAACALLAALALALPAPAAEFGAEVKFTRVAVVAYAADKASEKFLSSAQSRIEQILMDNGVEVIDREESSSIKKIWKKLEDPGYFITADDFVKNTRKHAVDGLVRMYLRADVSTVMTGFHSATAQADLRLVDEAARVDARTSFPMGAPGRPPSDGLTEQAALINAVQRAVDEAAKLLGLTLMDPASPRAMLFHLDGPVEPPAGAAGQPRAPRDLKADFVRFASLAGGRNTSEDVTCADRAPGGELAAVGGSLQALARGPQGHEMHYGSRVHFVDLTQEREISVFDTQQLGRKPRTHRGTSKVLDCLFVYSWRYFAAVTGDVLSLWDTERGLRLTEILLPFGTDSASLEVLRDGAAWFLSVSGDRDRQAVYRIASGAGPRGE